MNRIVTCLLLVLAGGAACAIAMPRAVEDLPELAPAVEGRPRIMPTEDYGEFPDAFALDGVEFVRNGAGLCEFGILGIDLYRAVLYVQRISRSAEELLACDQQMIIHLHFVRGLSRAQLSAAFDASVRVNAGDDFARYRVPLDELLAAMQEVDKGDSYTFVVRPGRHLVVQRNDVELARIADDAFVRLFVDLYFGDAPPDAKMKQAMIDGGK